MTILRQLKLATVVLLVVLAAACAADPDAEPSERSRGVEVSAGMGGDTISCPGRNSSCYANVRRACGDLGVEEVSTMGGSRVTTAGRSGGDDPFARADRQRSAREPISLRCKKPRGNK